MIPAWNEEANLRLLLPRLPRFIDEVILVDGESTDRTVEVARELCSKLVVVSLPPQGKGLALRAGFAAASGDIVVMMDADGSMDPAEISRFVTAVQSGFDLVKGSRYMDGAGSTDLTLVRSFGNQALRWLADRLYRSRNTDLCYGFMAFRRGCLPQMGLQSEGFEIETEIVVRSTQAGLRIAEVPSHEDSRVHGESHLRAMRDGLRVLRLLLAVKFGRKQPAPITSHDVDDGRVIDLTARAQPSPQTYS